MTAMLRSAVVAVALLCLTACTTTRPLADVSVATIKDEVAVGERVVIVATNGKTYDFEVTAVDPDALWGRDQAGKRYKVAFAAIESIQADQVSVGATVGGTATVLGAILTAAAVVAAWILVDALDSGDDNWCW